MTTEFKAIHKISIGGRECLAMLSDKGLTHPQQVGRLVRLGSIGVGCNAGKLLWKHSSQK